jgi:hypothetical protein
VPSGVGVRVPSPAPKRTRSLCRDAGYTVKGYLQGLPTLTDTNIPTAVGTNSEDVVLVMNAFHAIRQRGAIGNHG